MTVRELIEELQKYPDDCEVLFNHAEVGYVELGEIEDFDRTIDVIVLAPHRQPDGSSQQIDVLDYFETDG